MTLTTIDHPLRPDWSTAANCRTQGTAAFYPPLGGESRAERIQRERQAKSICAGCEVRNDCLAHALRHEERYGIWGGLNDAERQRLLIVSVRSA